MTGTRSAWRIELECPRCAHHQFQTLAARTTAPVCNRRSNTITQCAHCKSEWIITATLVAVDDQQTDDDNDTFIDARGRTRTEKPRRCGTPAGYRRHFYDNEPACDQCKQAHRDERRARRAQGLDKRKQPA